VLEVELKLEVSEAAASTLKGSPLLPPDPQVRTLRAVYFDTPDHRLAKAGFSLRIRHSEDGRVQTVKAGDAAAAGLFVRSEWEAPVEGDVPVLDHATPIAAMLGDRVDTIARVFEVLVERRTWMVQDGDATIEVAFDQGRVVADDRHRPICEAELELKEGPPAALFAFARKLDLEVPVRLGVLSKAERGYSLTGKDRRAFKAERIILKADAPIGEAFASIVQACLRQFRLNENVLLEHRSAEALHQARVALRRTRSAFSIFKPLLAGDETAAALREELRWLAGELGAARNLDVLVMRAEDQALSDSLGERLRSARDGAYDQVEAVVASPRSRALMLDLAEWLADGPWLHTAAMQERLAEPVHSYAATALDRLRRKVKKGGRRIETQDDEARHDLRKNAKKLRYASEFFRAAFDTKRQHKRYKQFIAALEELQDQLGALNDLATAPEEMRKLDLHDDSVAQALLGHEDKAPLLAAAADAHDSWQDAKRFWR
jgi:inorganic triphosphatase YgiF